MFGTQTPSNLVAHAKMEISLLTSLRSEEKRIFYRQGST